MFVSKKYHEQQLADAGQRALEQQEMLRQGYLGRITALEKHNEDLRKLIFAPSQYEVPETLREVDKVLTQNQEMPFPQEISTEEMQERDRLLNGTWDEVLN